ncbi:MAG TPA: transcriptional regulator, partial [Actinobacteria bacterium]|nr:transcriptional regulator [Actinomycetota bacterium]
QKVTVSAAAQEAPVMDLMAALRASVEATRQGKKKVVAAKPAARARVKVAAKTSAARPAA